MSADARVPDAADEEFLDRAFERAVAWIEEGTDPAVEDLLEGREHLRAETEALLRTARQVVVLRPRTMPRVAGFTLLHEIGRGGMGAVYLARQETLGGRRVALKVLPPTAGLSARARERFLTEARAIAHLRHPNVVTVHDVVADEGVHAYAMEWVDGASLGELIEFLKTKGTSPGEIGEREAVRVGPDLAHVREFLGRTGTGPPDSYPIFISRIGVAIARALAALHRTGLVHRDVKPSNILLRPDGTPLLSDFGLVHAADGAMTQTGQFSGTVAYASPEQLGGDPESLDARSDVYALGVTLYHALTLHLPFDDLRDRARRGRTPAGMLRLIESGRAAPLRVWNRRLPSDLETIVAKATDADPARRYPTADELADDLERMLALQPIHARPAGLLSRSVKFLGRNSAVALGIAAGSIVSLAIATAAVVYIFLVPRWVAGHVREARLQLLDPRHANAIFQSELWGLPSGPDEARNGFVVHAGIDAALSEYDAALGLAPFDDELREERETVAAFGSASREPVDPVEESTASTVAMRSGRCGGLSDFLAGDVDAALKTWGEWEARRDPRAEPDPFVEAALGVLYLVREQPARAYPRLREACQAFPNIGFLTTYLADAAVGCGDFEMAERLLAAAAGMPRQDPMGALARVRADLYAATGRDGDAEAIYGGALAATPTGLHFARFLESRGRIEEAVDQYVLMASTLRGRRVQLEIAVAIERWWTGLSNDDRLGRIRATLDANPADPRSLVALLRLYLSARLDADSSGSRPSGPARPSPSPRVESSRRSNLARLISTLADPKSSPSLQVTRLPELAEILEVQNMARWQDIPKYPRFLKSLQIWAWRSPCPSEISEAIHRAFSSLPRPAARTVIGGAALLAASFPVAAQNCPNAPCFQGLGDLPGGNNYSFATCLSSDGTTVGGGSSTALSVGEIYDHEAFIWQAGTGMVHLGDIPGNGEMGITLGLSADGSVAVGWSSSALATNPGFGYPEAFRWTLAGGMVALGDIPGNSENSWAMGVSDDGVLIAGFGVGTSPHGDAWRSLTWTSATGWVVQGGSTTYQSFFYGMSRDGQWISGRQDPDSSHTQSTRWSVSLGMEILGTAGPGIDEVGNAVSDNGVVIGQRGGAPVPGYESFVWTAGGGVQDLNGLPGGINFDVARGILRDGTLIVGTSESTAVMWDEALTIHRIADVLAGAGVVVPAGWVLTDAAEIVKNGSVITICGWGQNPSGDTEAWIAHYPEYNITPFCFGDGTSIPCPCGNTGMAGRGCQNSISTGGAELAGSGEALLSADTLQLTSSYERPTSFSLFWQGGTEVAAHGFGDGVGCMGNPLKRMFSHNAVGGVVTVPQGADLSVSARAAALGAPISPGSIRVYHVFYRDPNPSFCPAPVGSTFNTTNGLRVLWGG